MSDINTFLQGAVAACSLAAALFFLRFWVRTRDRFFLLFSIAFAVDSVHRAFLGLVEVPDDHAPAIYLVRLIFFAIIIAAIVDKNYAGKRP